MTSSQTTRLLALTNLTSNLGTNVPTVPGVSGASLDGRWLAINPSYSKSLFVYRLPEIVPAAQLETEANIGQFVFSPANDEVAICSRDLVELWSSTTWQ